MVNSSFFADGETYDTAVVTSNDHPGSATPSQAPSGFYPAGTVYNETDEAAAASSASDAASSAAAAATSAANAASAAATAAAAATATAIAGAAGTATPIVDGTATVGTSAKWAHEDHVHPTDTTRADAAATTAALALKAPLASPALTGVPTAPTAAVNTNTTQLASTAFVLAQAGALNPVMDGVATVGTATKFSREDHVHPTDSSRAAVASPALTGTPTAPTASAGTNTTQIATTAFVLANAISVAQGLLSGLTLSTAGSSASFGIAAGYAADSTNASVMALNSAYTKTTSAWAVGSGNGALDTGSIAVNTWYHAFLIKRTDTGVTDVLVSLSATAPTLPSPYTLFRRIGSMRTNGSSQWTKFFQLNDYFYWDTPVQDVVDSSLVTTAVTRTLTLPTGIKVVSLLGVGGTAAGGGSMLIYISSLDTADVAAGTAAFNVWCPTSLNSGAPALIATNTSGQVRSRVSSVGANMIIDTNGWIDKRGQS